MEEVYKALGWQGGTTHQVVAEIGRLKNESEVRRQALKETNSQIDYMKPQLAEYAGKLLKLERENTSLKAELELNKRIEMLAEMEPGELLNLVDSAKGVKACYEELTQMLKEIGDLVNVTWVGNSSTHAIREAIREIFRHSVIADAELTNLRNHNNDQAEEIRELNDRIRHAAQVLKGDFTPPQIDEIRKVRGLEPLADAQKGEARHGRD